MPISYYVNHARRLVIAAAHGVLTDEDVFAYQTTVWSRPDVAGYAELLDMSDVTEIIQPTIGRVQHLASVAAKMPSSGSSSRFAIIAPSDIAFGLGRMFQAFREHADEGTRKVAVFRRVSEAVAFLEVESESKPV